jgi:hypothetical protein
MTESASGYSHDALFHASDEEMIAGTAPFLRAALTAAEATVLICTERNARLLADALGRDPRIGFVDLHGPHRHSALTGGAA